MTLVDRMRMYAYRHPDLPLVLYTILAFLLLMALTRRIAF
jgi:hypothetical protein